VAHGRSYHGGSHPAVDPTRTNSARRFAARPLAVVPKSNGRSAPQPLGIKRYRSTPRAVSHSTTSSARRIESPVTSDSVRSANAFTSRVVFKGTQNQIDRWSLLRISFGRPVSAAGEGESERKDEAQIRACGIAHGLSNLKQLECKSRDLASQSNVRAHPRPLTLGPAAVGCSGVLERHCADVALSRRDPTKALPRLSL
jgi:hypothetical protein